MRFYRDDSFRRLVKKPGFATRTVLLLHLANLQSALARNMLVTGATSNQLINGLRFMRTVNHLTRLVVPTRGLRWAFHPAASAAQIHRR
jgi:hypothetical protein